MRTYQVGDTVEYVEDPWKGAQGTVERVEIVKAPSMRHGSYERLCVVIHNNPDLRRLEASETFFRRI